MNNARTVPVLWIAVASLILAGCASSPTSHMYLLQPKEDIAVAAVFYEHLQNAKICVEPVRVPNHLDRPVIITKAGDSELAYSEFHRWGESLSDNLQDVLIRNLGARLPTSVIWNDRAMSEVLSNYKICVQVLSLTGSLGETAELSARWNILSGQEYELLETGVYKGTTALESDTISSYVEAISELSAQLSDQIAGALRTLK
jgi:uncharacterized lipoprotein YmbA